MIKIKVSIINKLGLHARASAKFVALASKFQSHLEVTKDKKTVNGKSIMGVMTLAAVHGSELMLEIEGPDEQAMSEALVELVGTYFGEAE